MNDVISLVCPSCGGRLAVSKTPNKLICEHCGNEHLIRREGNNTLHDTHTMCPKCGQNDKSQKVSAIVSQRFAPPSEPQIQFTLPHPPSNKIGCSSGSFIGALALFGVSGLCSFVNSSSAGRNAPTFIIIVSLIALMFVVSGIFFKGEEKEKRKIVDIEYKKQITEYEQKFELQRSEALRLWGRAMEKWDMLYYCERDDCVFIPQENIYVSASRMSDILYK